MIAMLLALGLSGSAHAAEAPAETPAISLFDRALGSLADGNLQQGCAELEAVAEGGGPDTERAVRVAQLVNGLEDRYCTWIGVNAEIATDGRIELIVSQGLVWPVWFAFSAPLYFEGGSPGAVGGLIIGGLAFGIGGTYLLTEQFPVTTSQAMMIYSGEAFGAWYGGWIEGAAAGDSGNFTGRAAHIGMLVGGGIGVGLAAAFPDAKAGDVALVRSGGNWGTAFAAVSLAFVEPGSPSTALIILGGGTTVGLGITAGLTQPLDLRRREVNAINLGGYAGALTGGAVALIAQPDDKGVAALIGGGAAVGLGIGVLTVTRNRGPTASKGGLPDARFGMVTDGETTLPGMVLSGRW